MHHLLSLSHAARLLFALVVAMAIADVDAGVRKVAPGQAVQLAADEGLLLIAVDTGTALNYVRIKRDGTLFDGGTLKGIPKGRTAQVYVVPVGRYRWDVVRDSDLRFILGDDEEYAFDVVAGVVNYPGDLIYRSTGPFTAMAHVSNRGLLAMDWLEQQHPALARDHALAYRGHYPDPFPALYREQRAKAGKIEDRTTPVPVRNNTLPLPIDALWKPSQLDAISLNPAGDMVAIVTTEKRGEDWFWLTRIVDLRAEVAARVVDSPKEIARIDWAGNRALVVSIGESHEPDTLFVIHIDNDVAGKLHHERLKVPRQGVLVDALPNEPGHILFASMSMRVRNYGVQVHKLDISSQKSLDRFRFGSGDALDSGVDNDLAWFADGSGRLRAAVAYRDDTRVLMHGGDGQFREVMTFEDTENFSPFALSADGNLLYGWSEKDREQRDLVELDPATGKIGRTLFSRPGVDVQSALFDARRNLIGATYYEDGQLVSQYLDAGNATLYGRLQRAFPGKTVNILDRDDTAKQFLLLVGGSDQPSDIYHFDSTANRASLLEQTRPWLAERRFAPAQVVRAKGKGGFDIEAYLTLPLGVTGKVPLVLFPHGGPIGVRDSRYFDPEVQFIASLGYAVLQVNFRGSEGYGKAFREAGKRNYGTLIEDDIDAALTAALAAHPIDRERMCAAGTSYGGYSALVSAIRWPGRFRCAVSIAGVSDKALFFTASDSGRSKEGREALEEAIGDPHADLDIMREYSPLYRHTDLVLPVLLAHGTEDLRVDYEHARRLVRMLNLSGHPPSLITLEGEGHSVEGIANRKKLWEGVAGFLGAHLGSGSMRRPPAFSSGIIWSPGLL